MFPEYGAGGLESPLHLAGSRLALSAHMVLISQEGRVSVSESGEDQKPLSLVRVSPIQASWIGQGNNAAALVPTHQSIYFAFKFPALERPVYTIT